MKYAYVGIWCEEVEIEDVDLSKSSTIPFDPLLTVRDPYNSRNIKELYCIAIENHSWVYIFLRWSSLHNTNAKGTNTFDSSLSLELDVDVSSWLKLKARHWWSLQVAPSYTIWEALLCIRLHLSIMWSSTSFKHVIPRDGYLELALINHDHQHLMSSSHRHLKSLSRCEPMRIT